MGFLSKFEGKMEDTVEGAAEKMGASPLSPVQIAKKAEKQMRRNKMVGAGKQYAPTLYTILVSEADDGRMFGYYPTLAGETETYLSAKAAENGLVMDGQPLVRFVADTDLKHGKFEVIAEMVAAPIIAQLREEEMERYGLATPRRAVYSAPGPRGASRAGRAAGAGRAANAGYAAAGGAAGYAAGAGAQPSSRGFDPYGAPANDGYGEQGAYSPAANKPQDASSDEDYGYGYDDSGLDVSAGTDAEYDDAGFSAQPGVGYAAGAEYAAGASANAGYAAGVEAGVGAAAEGVDVPKTMVFGQAPAAGVQTPQPAAVNLNAYIYDVTNDRAFTLTGRPMGIGRESRNEIVIPDINASRQHAEIRMEPSGAWILSDLGSTNGTFVNGRQIKSSRLRDADRIIVGTTELEFQLL